MAYARLLPHPLEANRNTVASGLDPTRLFGAMDQVKDPECDRREDADDTQAERCRSGDAHSVEPLAAIRQAHVVDENRAVPGRNGIESACGDRITSMSFGGRFVQVIADLVQPALSNDSTPDCGSDRDPGQDAAADQTVTLPPCNRPVDPPNERCGVRMTLLVRGLHPRRGRRWAFEEPADLVLGGTIRRRVGVRGGRRFLPPGRLSDLCGFPNPVNRRRPFHACTRRIRTGCGTWGERRIRAGGWTWGGRRIRCAS